MFANVGPSNGHWLNAGSGLAGVHYTMIFSKEETRVEFVLSRGTPAQNKAMFDYLYERRPKLETNFGAPLEWRRLDDKKVSMVVFAKEFVGFDRENWPAMVDWLTQHISKLKETFDPEIGSLRQFLANRFPKESS